MNRRKVRRIISGMGAVALAALVSGPASAGMSPGAQQSRDGPAQFDTVGVQVAAIVCTPNWQGIMQCIEVANQLWGYADNVYQRELQRQGRGQQYAPIGTRQFWQNQFGAPVPSPYQNWIQYYSGGILGNW